MAIREKGYYKWKGALKESRLKWSPIFREGIKRVFRKKKAKLLFILCSSSFFFFLVMVYISSLEGIEAFRKVIGLLQTEASLFNTFYTNGFLFITLLVLSAFAGAELICSDYKFKSFTLYLSRPISFFDYLAGKFSIVLFYLLLFTLVPGILLLTAKILLTGFSSLSPFVILASIIYPIVYSLFLSSLILMLSSLSPNIKFVNVMFFVIYFSTEIIAGVFYGIFRNKDFFLLSISQNLRHFSEFLFKQKTRMINAPGWVSGLILISLTGLFILIIHKRLQKAEV